MLRSSLLLCCRSHDGKLLISAQGKEAKIWDTKDTAERPKPLWETMVQGKGTVKVSSVAMNPKGTLFCLGGGDEYNVNFLRVYAWRDPETKELVHNLSDKKKMGHTKKINCLAFARDGKKLYSGSRDKKIKIWDTSAEDPTAWKLIKTLVGHTHFVTCISESPCGRYLVSGGDDGTLRVWDTVTGAELRTILAFKKEVSGVQFLTGAMIACSSKGNAAKLYNLASKAKHEKLEGHEKVVRAVALSADGMTLISGSDDATVRIWNIHSNEDTEPEVIRAHTELIRGVDISKDGLCIISGSKDGFVKIWRCNNKKNWVHDTDVNFGVPVYCVMFAHDGESFFAGGKKGNLKQYNIPSKEAAKAKPTNPKILTPAAKDFKGHSHIVNSLAATKPFSDRLVSASSDNKVIVWDTKSGEHLKILRGHTDGVISVAISADDTTILSGSHDRTAKLWSLESGSIMHTFEGHTSKIMSVAFHPTEKYIVTGSYDRSWKLWSLETNTPLFTSFDDEAGGVNSVLFSPDGNHLVTGLDSSDIDIADLTPLYNLTTQFFEVCFESERKFDDEGKDFDWSKSETRTALKKGEKEGSITTP